MSSILKVNNIQVYSASTLTVTPPVSLSSTLAVTGVSTFTEQLKAADGSAAAPAYAFSSDTDVGIYYSGAGLNFSTGSNNTLRLNSSQAKLASAVVLGWTATDGGGSLDLGLARDAANTLAQRNGTSAQSFRLYNTFTDASNYERAAIWFNGGTVEFNHEFAGTGASRRMRFRALDLVFHTSGTDRWRVASTGHILSEADNTYDIGASGASRPRSVYVGTDITIGQASANYLRAQGNISTSYPYIEAAGSDTNVGIILVAKGTGEFRFRTNGASGTDQFRVAHTASAVNYAQATGSITGAGVTISAQGTDTNISFNHTTKGTGAHHFNTGGGEQVRIANTPSAVNYLLLQGAATGTGVSVSASGTDTDIDINLTPKGEGAIVGPGIARNLFTYIGAGEANADGTTAIEISYNLPANTMQPGDKLVVKAWGECADNANAKDTLVGILDEGTGQVGYQATMQTNEPVHFEWELELVHRGTGVQTAWTENKFIGDATITSNGIREATTLDETEVWTIFAGTDATAASDVTWYGMTVEYWQCPPEQ